MTPSPPPPKWLAIADALEAAIRSGEWAPGGRLPGVRALRGRFGVQQESVTRALLELASRGLVATAPQRGSFVVDPLPPASRSLEERVAALEAWRGRVEGERGD